MFSRCLMIDCLRSFCLVKSRSFAHLATLGLPSMMLHCANVKSVKLVSLKAAYRDDKLLWKRQDLSCMYLAHHELDSVLIVVIVIIIIMNRHWLSTCLHLMCMLQGTQLQA